jgi:alkaline phosphatase D
VITLEGLRPDTEYHYAVQLGDESRTLRDEAQRFRTYPSAGASGKIRIVFGGCSGYVPPNERMWDTIRGFAPAAFLTLGDNVYVDDPESPDQQRYCYYQRQSRPEFRRLVAGAPVYAVWDDHDFAMDDSIGGTEPGLPYWKPMVSEIFRQNWVNPAHGDGVDEPGIWFDFRVGDAHFIMLDSRTYRTDPGRFDEPGVADPTMLGPRQLAWLKETLRTSDATFKLLVSPVSWHELAKTGKQGFDSWAGFPAEREAIFSLIRDERIPGVVLLSSDRHRSDAWLHARSGSYDLHEFASGQFTNQHTHRVIEASLFGYNELPSFGVLTFDTAAADPSLTYEIVNIDGEVKRTLTVRRSQMQ